MATQFKITKPIEGFKHYTIDKQGIVYFKGKPIKRHARKNTEGYVEGSSLRVYLYDSQKQRRTRSILSLMANAWLEKPNDLVKPVPKDKNWSNTNLDNIVWVPIVSKSFSKNRKDLKLTFWKRCQEYLNRKLRLFQN